VYIGIFLTAEDFFSIILVVVDLDLSHVDSVAVERCVSLSFVTFDFLLTKLRDFSQTSNDLFSCSFDDYPSVGQDSTLTFVSILSPQSFENHCRLCHQVFGLLGLFFGLATLLEFSVPL